MGSTAGGFLLGFGTSIFLLCSIGYFMVISHQSDLVKIEEVVVSFYEITHSPPYESSMYTLEGLAPYAAQLAQAVESVPTLGGVSEYLKTVPKIASFIRQVHDLSETGYEYISTIREIPMYFEYGMFLSLYIVGAGGILIIRADRNPSE